MKHNRQTKFVFNLCLLVFAIGATALPASAIWPAAPLSAKWIWTSQKDYNQYNQTIVARKTFTLEKTRRATLRITADSFYRLLINNQWVNDGPCRSWPEHYQYDVIDVTSYLVAGQNEVQIVARYYGTGDFHKVPKQAGLLAQLDVETTSGKRQTIITDGSWKVAEVNALIRNTPKASIQMEPAEFYDARLESALAFSKAKVLFDTDGGPWKDLNPRDVALMTKQPMPVRSFGGAKVVKFDALNFCLPAARLVNPGVIEANHNTSCASGMATILETQTGCTITLQNEGFKASINGQAVGKDPIKLEPGKHLLLAFVRAVTGHEKEKSIRFLSPSGFRLVNPIKSGGDNPWCFIRFPEFAFATNDLRWHRYTGEDARISGIVSQYTTLTDAWLKQINNADTLKSVAGSHCEVLPYQEMFVEDWLWQFNHRQVVADAATLISNPGGMIRNTPELSMIQPSPQGDVELLFDLGEQNCGYYYFDLIAKAGVILDICSVEYIAPDGRIQFTGSNYRNGMRYITKEGANRFTSYKRRSGRYIFLTFRNMTEPVCMRGFQLIESTYPVDYIGSFTCSDARLDKIWDISTRTLKLCMEDTFTDCPLYEQTHWVGDARNEALLAYPVFGSTDLGRRCIRITAQSLEHYPFAGCQTPSCWDVLIPAWSFLWGISTWDYYWHTGHREFLKEMYPYVIQNLKGAEKYISDQDLFSGPFWNFFDWTPIDQNQKTVMHNNLLMIGAIDAALKAAAAIDDSSQTAWLKALRQRLVTAVNKQWDARKKAYPDSLLEDGKPSPSTSQHTSFLSILYDVVEPANFADARENLLNPPEKMVRLGSPFAMLYLYETYEKLGMEDKIIEEIYKNYLPMLELGATTVWESFSTGTTGSKGFPTRSHCHAWSSAPSYFLNRIILGIKPTAPAAQTVQLSPRLSGLTWAKGTISTVKGAISVSWKLAGNKVEIECAAPDTIQINFATNPSLDGKEIWLNGKKVG